MTMIYEPARRIPAARAGLPMTGFNESSFSAPRPIHVPAFDALVLDAGLRQSLVTVRSLGSRGQKVAALETVENVPAFSSRWSEKAYVCPAGYDTEEYLDCLNQLLDDGGARVLITSHDGTIALIRRNRERLQQRVRIALASERALTIAVNKELTLSIASRLGIAVPNSVTANDVSDIPRALREIGLPAVIKPTESWISRAGGGVRVTPEIVNSRDDAHRVVDTLTRLGGTCLFQQLLSGRREAVMLLYANGEVFARFAQWAQRTAPAFGGESVMRQSIAVPDDIGSQAERLVREIDLEGYSEVEFLRDAAGVPYLMEINPRLSASVEIAVRSGVDFPHLLFQWASGGRIDRVPTYRVGRRMRYLKGDVMSTIATFRDAGRPGNTPPLPTLLSFCASFFKPTGYDYLDWRDPIPAVRATAAFTRSAWRKLMRRKRP
jgi:predicted ATP-grasp superfamily ATP-dependent carboligase